jgi:hypothetical protein
MGAKNGKAVLVNSVACDDGGFIVIASFQVNGLGTAPWNL